MIVKCVEVNGMTHERLLKWWFKEVRHGKGYAYPRIGMIVWIGWVHLPSICVVIGADGYAYPGCKVMRTLASVEIEIILILGLPCCLSSSSMRCLENRFSPRLTELRAYLVGMAVESEPFEDPIETETPKSPYTVAPPTCHVETTRMAMRVLPVMSPSLSVSIAEVAVMPDSAFRNRFRSSYDSSPSPTFPVWKRYRGTSELILDTDSEGDELGDEDDEEEEDKEVEESLDSDSKSENVEDEGPTAEDEDPAPGDEGLAAGDEGPSIRVESLGLGGDEAAHEKHEQERTAVTFRALWRPVLALEAWAGQVDTQMVDMS
nr:hypothetical protein [Tanacetum cinerariifolium]